MLASLSPQGGQSHNRPSLSMRVFGTARRHTCATPHTSSAPLCHVALSGFGGMASGCARCVLIIGRAGGRQGCRAVAAFRVPLTHLCRAAAASPVLLTLLTCPCRAVAAIPGVLTHLRRAVAAIRICRPPGAPMAPPAARYTGGPKATRMIRATLGREQVELPRGG